MGQMLPDGETYLCVDAAVCPNEQCVELLLQMKPGESIADTHDLIGFCQKNKPVFQQFPIWPGKQDMISNQLRFQHPMDFVKQNAIAITQQFALATAMKDSIWPSTTNTILGNQIFIDSGVKMECCTINTEEGPVFIGANALIMEGTTIRGPVSIGEEAVVKMGTRIYGGTSIGKKCTVGGEIKNSIISNYSNKAHDGYLGDSYIGEWCNLGAGTSNSNVKNNAGDITMWNNATKEWVAMGKKCGTVMGDYSKTAINTSLNTGTTIGICCSIHGGEVPPKHVPSFTWGLQEKYTLDLALNDINNWKAFKNQVLADAEKQILTDVYYHFND
jgi:UDP-N-acetylglucosamine diphosphorylase/glucosamine-1-phosphate N-acetyltransferase